MYFTFIIHILSLAGMQKQEVRHRIIEAADQRFADYGFQKTTMAEIAIDCNMSVGNLYRFFKNKEAIAAASVQRCFQHKLQLGLSAANEHKEALKKLNAFLLTGLEFTYSHIKDQRHLHELVMVIHRNHADILKTSEKNVIHAMTGFLQQGIEQQEIKVIDSERVAYLLYRLIMHYNYPLSLKNNALDCLRRDLMDSMEMIYTGIRTPSKE